MTQLCTPVSFGTPGPQRNDGVSVRTYPVPGPIESGATRIVLVRDRNVIVYHADSVGVDADALATVLHQRLDGTQVAAPSTATNGSSATGAATVTASPSSPPAAGTVVVLPGDGVLVGSKADIDKLTWLPAKARSFLASELARISAADAAVCVNPTQLYVEAYRSPDLIRATVFTSGCGGGEVLWGDVSGTWKVIVQGQSAPACSEIAAAGWRTAIPRELMLCTDASGRIVQYVP